MTLVPFLLIVLLLIDTVFVIFGSRVVDSVRMVAIVVFLQRPATQILRSPHWVPSTAGLYATHPPVFGWRQNSWVHTRLSEKQARDPGPASFLHCSSAEVTWGASEVVEE